uniref:Uncharacterized protein n=1 Tax=Candidatus Kentrum sp. DK TaxID=2126562 RepID=A0A450SFH7_9GAMM|nr:MAG: hypothetical protein BECKDK2373C_GA0170839_103226 [Candidatus Kentron sp. DK]
MSDTPPVIPAWMPKSRARDGKRQAGAEDYNLTDWAWREIGYFWLLLCAAKALDYGVLYMQLSELDRKLAKILEPLVEMKARVRVAPFANTLCLGFHYFLAHGSSPIPIGRIDFDNWNKAGLENELLKFNNLFAFYSTKNKAASFENKVKDLGLSGKANSEAVTRYRQRYAFLPRSCKEAESLARGTGGFLTSDLLENANAIGLSSYVFTDIFAQAKVLIENTVSEQTMAPTMCYLEREWPLKNEDTRKPLPIFIYGAPSVSYMLKAREEYIKLFVDDQCQHTMPDEYETHIIWYTPPELSEYSADIRNSLRRYHTTLFSAAGTESAHLFEATSVSCNEVLGAKHPSFVAKVFSDPKSFQACLRDHHSPP